MEITFNQIVHVLSQHHDKYSTIENKVKSTNETSLMNLSNISNYPIQIDSTN